MRQKRKRQLVIVSAYTVTREYGGPEEGGWFYNAWELLESRKVRPGKVDQTIAQLDRKYDHLASKDRRGKRRDLGSVACDGTVRVRTEDVEGEMEKPAPHYE